MDDREKMKPILSCSGIIAKRCGMGEINELLFHVAYHAGMIEINFADAAIRPRSDPTPKFSLPTLRLNVVIIVSNKSITESSRDVLDFLDALNPAKRLDQEI